MNKETFGAFIAESRREAELTQKALAETLHVTDKAVSKWERGLSYPDVTLLEPLAVALRVSVEELMACRRLPERKEEAIMKEETRGLLDLSTDSLRAERRRGWKRVAVLTILLVVVLTVLGAVYLSGFVTETRNNTIFMKETVGDTQYLYVQEQGHLLRLECGEDVDFDAITVDDRIYALECRWNRKTYQGTVTSCEETGGVALGGLMDATFETLTTPLFDYEEVYYTCENYVPNLYGAETGIRWLCDFRFWIEDEESGEVRNILTVKECVEAIVANPDGDGQKEVVVRTRWPEKPYTVYDWQDGEIVQTWPESIHEELREKLVAIWER